LVLQIKDIQELNRIHAKRTVMPNDFELLFRQLLNEISRSPPETDRVFRRRRINQMILTSMH